MKLFDEKVIKLLHWIILYPLALIGAVVIFGGLWAFLDAKETIPAEKICTSGYPCHERFD